MTIHAHTDQGASYPAYINISERVSNQGDVIVTVRSAGESGASSIVLDRDRAIALAHDILRHYRAPTPDVKAAVDRFLGWKLPQDFYPDAGVSFDRVYAEKWGMPSGTNLLHAGQAKEMFEYVLRDPAA
jgi:hypothetical protein